MWTIRQLPTTLLLPVALIVFALLPAAPCLAQANAIKLDEHSRRAPDGGYAQQIMIGHNATKAKPHRLVVWLHPDGGSMNDPVRKLAPLFAERGFAVLLITKEHYGGWFPNDASKVLKTIASINNLDEVTHDKPLLMGYGAGGQLALSMWAADPGKFGGLILNAAYPLTIHPETHAMSVGLAIKDQEAAKNTPLFVLTGTRDAGTPVWAKTQEDYKAKQIPLTIEYVKGMGHRWMFGADQQKRLGDWLAALAKGEKPVGTVGSPPGPRPKLGVSVEGNRVDRVTSRTPADVAGVKVGDRITAINNEKTPNRAAVVNALTDFKDGDTITLTIQRGDQTLKLPLTFGKKPEPPAEKPE